MRDDFIQERLDYGEGNENLVERFPGAYIANLDRDEPDHVSIMIHLIRCESDDGEEWQGLKLARFKALWAENEGCEVVVRNAWENPCEKNEWGGVLRKMSRCLEDLKGWNKSAFGDILAKLTKAREELRRLRKGGMMGALVGKRQELEREEADLGGTFVVSAGKG